MTTETEIKEFAEHVRSIVSNFWHGEKYKPDVIVHPNGDVQVTWRVIGAHGNMWRGTRIFAITSHERYIKAELSDLRDEYQEYVVLKGRRANG